jgi:hypothetical protein
MKSLASSQEAGLYFLELREICFNKNMYATFGVDDPRI